MASRVLRISCALASCAKILGALSLEGASPVAKVVKLVKEIKVQVEKEADDDSEAYEKYSCWCQTNRKEKTSAVATATASLDDLTSFLAEATARRGVLAADIDGHAASAAADGEALAAASGLRAKARGEFEADEADMKATLAALRDAVSVLSSVQLVQRHGGNDVQVAPSDAAVVQSLVQVRERLKHHRPRFREVMRKDLFDFLGSMGADAQQPASAAFLGEHTMSGYGATPSGAAAGSKSFNSRSGRVLGTLATMKDEFSKDLTSLHMNEMSAVVEFEKLRAAKQGEIMAATQQKEAKEAEMSELVSKMAEGDKSKAALEKAKAADMKFLVNLEGSCDKEAAEYERRVATRTEEVKALSETLKILTEDEARDLFSKTLSFVQVSSRSSAVSKRVLVKRAIQRLQAVGTRHGNAAISLLAEGAKLDDFEEVKAAMDKMVSELKVQQKQEYEKSEYCKEEIGQNEGALRAASDMKKDLDAKHKLAANNLEDIGDTISKLNADVTAMAVSVKEAGEARRAENAAFQSSISEHRATVSILKKALERLKQFYDGEELVQIRAHAAPGAPAPPPPQAPDGYSKSAGAGGVLQMIMKIIADAEAAEKELIVSEQGAQADYEALVSDSSASVEADRQAISEKEAEHAEMKALKGETHAAGVAAKKKVDKLGDTLKARHLECDWLLKNYMVRQRARQEETEAIMNAKSILSGADFGGT